MQLIRATFWMSGLVLASTAVLATAQTPASTPAGSAEQAEDPAASVDARPLSREEWLTAEVARLTAEITQLRQQLAEARLQASEAGRALAELQQFISDHREFGTDFERYQEVKAVAERESRARAAEERQVRREAYRADRLARFRAARAQREREQAERNRLERYQRAGFSHAGLDVFTSRMAFSYRTRDRNPVRVDYDPFIGLYYRPSGTAEIDYTRMTISGSVLNSVKEVRNIGVAIAFFDENGNQVGSETVQINNARPDVPYPFTSTIEMALNRPFDSSSVYVLYADPVEGQ